MLYTLAPQPWLIFLDDAGLYLPNGQLAIYMAGTMSPATVYFDAAGTAHPFPITLDGAGRIPGGLYLDPDLSYKFVLHAPQIEAPLDGAIIKSQDNIKGSQSLFGDTLTIYAPGDYIDLNVEGVSIIEYRGDGDASIRGMVGGRHGQSILIRNLTVHTVWLYGDWGPAPLGARLANLIKLGPMPLVGLRSSARYTYISPGWWMELFEMGEPLTAPFNAADYGGQGGQTWTVEPADVIYENFFILGRSLTYSFFLQATSVGGTPDQYLTRLLPYGWQLLSDTPVVSNTIAGILVSDNGTPYTLGVAAMLDHSTARFERDPHGTVWTPSTNQTSLVGRLQLILN